METYANQKVIVIDKPKYKKDFLQVGNKEWQEAAKNIKQYGTFKLYLYLASNNNEFIIALSQKAVQNATGISRETYHRAVDELISQGYLVQDRENGYFTFYPSAHTWVEGYTHTWVEVILMHE